MAQSSEQVLLQVNVETASAVKNIAELKLKVEDLTDARNALVAGGKKFSDLTAEEQQQYVQLDQQIKAYNKEISESTRKIQNQIIAEQEYKGTLKGLCAELANAKDKLRAMSLTDPKYKEQEAQVAALNNQIKTLEESYGTYARSVGDYERANKSLKDEIRQLTDELIKLKVAGQDNSEEYVQMSQRLALLRDATADVQAQTNALASDSAGLDAMTKGFGTMMGVVGLLNLTMGENAKENEKVKETQAGLQKAMSALMILTTLNNNLQKQGILYQTALNLKTKASVLLKTQEAKAEAKDAVAKTADTAATGTLTTAQTILNAVMAASPLVWLAAAVAAVCAAVYGLVAAYKALSGPTKEQQAMLDKEKEEIDNLKREYENFAEVLENSGATKEEVFVKEIEKLDELSRAYEKYRDDLIECNARYKDIQKAAEDYAAAQDDLKTKLQDSKNYLDGVLATAARQAEKEALGLEGVKLELDNMYDKMDGLREMAGVMFEKGVIGAQQYLAYLGQIQQMEDAEYERIQAAERKRRAAEARQRAKAKADAAYNAELKALEAEGKVDAERRKREHATAEEEFLAKQQLEKRKLDLQKKYNKITEAEYQAALDLMAEQAETFAVEQAEKQAEAVRRAFDAAIQLAGGKNLAGRLADIKEQYDAAEKAIRDSTELTAEEKTFYLTQLEKRRTAAVQAARDEEGKEEREAAEAAKKAAADAAKAREEELARQVTIAGNDARRVYELRKAYIEKELEMEGLAAEKKAKLEQELAELRSQYAMDRINAAQEYVSQVTDIMSSLNTTLQNIETARTAKVKEQHDERKKSLDKQLSAGLISQKRYDKEVAKMDEELAAKEAEIARDQAKREKALSIFQIAVNTAAAIMKIWAEVPKADFGVSTGVLTALAAAVGAAQIAAVASQPLPTAGKGGLIQGASHEQGGVLVNTEGGERIVAADPSKAFPELLNLISYIGKHADIPDTGYSARAAGLVAGSNEATSNVDMDKLAEKIGEQVGRQIADLNIVMRWTDFEEESQLRARIADSAKK